MRALAVLKGPAKAKTAAPLAKPGGGCPHVDWSRIFDAFLYTKGNAPNPKRQGHFHPSSGILPEFEGCRRALVFDLLCAPENPGNKPAVVQRIFDNGHSRHIGLQKTFTAMAAESFMGITSFGAEVHFEHPTYPIEGHADAVVGMSNGSRYILDFKTIKADKWEALAGPEDKHIVQVNTYLGLSGDSVGYVIYENKNNQKWAGPMSAYRVEFSQEMWQRTLDYSASVLRGIATKKLPDYSEKVCKAYRRECSYTTVCDKQLAGLPFDQVDHRSPAIKHKQRLPLLRW